MHTLVERTISIKTPYSRAIDIVESFALENVHCKARVRISCASERKIQNDVISDLKLLEGISFPLMAMFELLAVISVFFMLCARAICGGHEGCIIVFSVTFNSLS